MKKCSTCFQVYQWPPWLLPPWALLLKKKKNKYSEAILEFYGLEMGTLSRHVWSLHLGNFLSCTPGQSGYLSWIVYFAELPEIWDSLELANIFLLKCLCVIEGVGELQGTGNHLCICVNEFSQAVSVSANPQRNCSEDTVVSWKWQGVWQMEGRRGLECVIHWVLDNTV